jgi:Crp-like helix-turn-helix domain
MRYQELLFSASVLGAAIALHNCRHPGNMRFRTVDFPARNSATIELTHYPHGSGSRRRITFANSSPEARFCRWLLQSVDRAESDTLTLTQEFLAEMLGVRRTSVTEVAAKIQETGAIHYSRGVIKILDRPALEKMSCDFWINRFSCARLA